eukprot:10276837-Lingulodinium_polyedra.AAC.1
MDGPNDPRLKRRRWPRAGPSNAPRRRGAPNGALAARHALPPNWGQRWAERGPDRRGASVLRRKRSRPQ